ncbi:hypothetical protein [Nonomuraea rubra]|uniref:hypothetical protein n=1 Tax=Nonomuraea rubra TaxID=46180 RepID=UPI0031E72019
MVSNPGTTAVDGWSIVFELASGCHRLQPQNGHIRRTAPRSTLTPALLHSTPCNRAGTTEPYRPRITLSSPSSRVSCLIDGANCDGSGSGRPPAKPPVSATVRRERERGQFRGGQQRGPLNGWTIVFDTSQGRGVAHAA